jgi:hypothetical protein
LLLVILIPSLPVILSPSLLVILSVAKNLPEAKNLARLGQAPAKNLDSTQGSLLHGDLSYGKAGQGSLNRWDCFVAAAPRNTWKALLRAEVVF